MCLAVSPWVDLDTGATIETRAAISLRREYRREMRPPVSQAATPAVFGGALNPFQFKQSGRSAASC
jgi:hypothetical protein